MRTLAWFSCGAASAIAARYALNDDPATLVVRCIVDNEHDDNGRFSDDMERWFGKPVINLRSSKYRDCWDVWHKRRFLNGPGGALCTVEMKKKVRQEFSQPDDIHIFGFTVEETDRALRFDKTNIEINARYPLIDNGITKQRCYEIIHQLGVTLPAMYRLGYHNANCIGCVKGGAGYWNKIRVDFPDVFARMIAMEAEIGASCIRNRPLATLPPDAGYHTDLALPECGAFCGENE